MSNTRYSYGLTFIHRIRSKINESFYRRPIGLGGEIYWIFSISSTFVSYGSTIRNMNGTLLFSITTLDSTSRFGIR